MRSQPRISCALPQRSRADSLPPRRRWLGKSTDGSQWSVTSQSAFGRREVLKRLLGYFCPPRHPELHGKKPILEDVAVCADFAKSRRKDSCTTFWDFTLALRSTICWQSDAIAR